MQSARTIGALDSHAWALFRLKQFDKARVESEQVIAYAGKKPDTLTAELPFHLAEIYRALGRTDDARKAYQMALELRPDNELFLQIDSALNGTTI